MQARVLIVGGGLIGSSIAWRLAQRGAQVTLADAGALGGEASIAGAGMLSPGGEFDEPSPWVDLGVASLRVYPEFLKELAAEAGIAVDYRVCGCLHLDQNPAPVRIEFQRRAGIVVEQHPQGLFYPGDAIVDPVAMLGALRCAAEARGVHREIRRVSEVNADDFSAVVIAAGAWSSQLRITCQGRSLPLPLAEPVKGHLIGFEMQAELLGPFVRSGHTYVLQRSDGFVVAGTNEEHAGFDASIDARVCEEIHARAAALLPALASVPAARRWIGFRPGPFRAEGPFMRRLDQTNVWLAYGHYRNGILLTPLTAERIAAEIAQ